MPICIGYHTLEDRENVDQIEKSGPIRCAHSKAWLGIGYYFWDTNISWAHRWGESCYKDGKYMIFQIDISRDDTMFDIFGDVSHQIALRQAAELIVGMAKSKTINVTVPKIIEYLKRTTGFSDCYSSIRAADYPDKENIYYFAEGKPNFMFAAPRVQICVMEKKSLLLQTFKVVYPEHYKQD